MRTCLYQSLRWAVAGAAFAPAVCCAVDFDVVARSDLDATFLGAARVIVGPSGGVVTIGATQGDNAVDELRLHTKALSVWSSQTVASSASGFDAFGDVTLTHDNTITYTANTGSTRAVYQSLGGMAATFIDMADVGDTNVGVNADGQVFYGRTDPLELRRYAGSVTTVYPQSTPTQPVLTDYGDRLTQQRFSKRVSTSDGQLVTYAESSSGGGIFAFTETGYTERVGPTLVVDAGTYATEELLGASGPTQRTLVLSSDAAGGRALVHTSAGEVRDLGGFDVAAFASNNRPVGMMTPGGNAAVYLPDGNVGRVVFDGPNFIDRKTFGGSDATTVTDDGFTLETLLIADASVAPAINDNGWIVMRGEVSKDGIADDAEAVLAWNVVTSQTFVVAYVGQRVTLSETTYEIESLGGVDADQRAVDAFTDALGDSNNVLALALHLVNETNPDGIFAVVTTDLGGPVPEPSMLAALLFAGVIGHRRVGSTKRATVGMA